MSKAGCQNHAKMKIVQKIIFFGTAEFAVPALEALVKNGYSVTVITTSDKPTGRKQILTPPPVKTAAQKLGLDVLQTDNLKNSSLVSRLPSLNANIGVVAAYGKIIPEEIISSFPLGILNIHPSLLPKYRGASPIQTAIFDGEKETGVTIIKIDEQIDHGPILASQELKTVDRCLYEELHKRLAKAGAELLIKILPDYMAGKIKPLPQNHLRATFSKKILKEDGLIDWRKGAEKIHNQFRALHCWPGVWTKWRREILKIADCSIADYQLCSDGNCAQQNAGKIFEKNGLVCVFCGEGCLELKRVQPEGKKEMDIRAFLAGHKDFIGSKFG